MAADLLAEERQIHIRTLLRADGRVVAAELARRFDVSEDTIRRDLRLMAADGACVRVYGGALARKAQDRPLRERQSDAVERKQRLAAAVERLLPEKGLVFLDGGSTNLVVARRLTPRSGVIMATNAPAIGAALLKNGHGEVVMIGGRVSPATGTAHGLRALEELRRMRPDFAVIGACALDVAAGLTAFDAEEAEFKRALVAQSDVCCVAALDEKVGAVAPFKIADAAECRHAVVEATLNRDVRSRLADVIEYIHVADRGGETP